MVGDGGITEARLRNDKLEQGVDRALMLSDPRMKDDL